MLFTKKLRFLRRPRLIGFYGKKRLNRYQRRGLKIIALALVFIIFTTMLASRVRPLVEEVAVWEISNAINYVIYEAINEKIDKGSLDYSELVTLEKDGAGSISALITNTAKINKLQTEIVSRVIELVAEKGLYEIKIPLGNIIGGSFFIGRGIKIPIKIVSLSAVEASFTNDFTTAGINQTRHKIYLKVHVALEFLMTGYTSGTDITIEIPIAETVIVGDVPENYTYFEESGNSSDYDMFEKYYITK